MNTPRWYGSIGVMSAPHLHRTRRRGLHRLMRALAAALRSVGAGEPRQQHPARLRPRLAGSVTARG